MTGASRDDASGPGRSAADERRAGLCAGCRHVRRLTSGKGSVFFRCGLSDRDPRFPKYPPLPVLACPGFAPAAEKG